MNAAVLAPRPDHVPEQLYVDIDAIMNSDDALSPRLPEVVSELFQKHGPIIWTPRDGGYWLMGGFQEVYDMARDPETFSSNPHTLPQNRDMTIFAPVQVDGAAHAEFRAPLVEALRPALIHALEKEAREIAARLATEFKAKGKGNAFKDYTEPLPVIVFLKLLGLPTDRLEEFRNYVAQILRSPDSKLREEVGPKVAAIFQVTIAERRIKRENDLVSKLLDCKIFGREPTEQELLAFCLMLFSAGLDTVVSSMSFGIYHLAKDQDLQARLRADPSLIPDAIEELMRRYSIVQHWRFVTRDCEFHGVRMKKLDRVLYCLPAVNLDPAAYDHPLEVDLDRDEPAHIGFFVGPHRCVGSHLARMELRVGYEEFLKHVPPFRLDPEKEVVSNVGFVYGLEDIPLIW